MKNPFDKILNWYFTKNSLPYWSIFLIDCLIIVFSGLLTYWMFNNAVILFDNAQRVHGYGAENESDCSGI